MISSGHRFDEVKNYTIGQLNIFLKSVDEIEKQKMRWENMVLMAQRLDEKDYKKFVKALEGDK